MQNYSCPTCGAQLYWDAAKQCLHCQYCDSSFSPNDFTDDTLAPAEDTKVVASDKLSDNTVVSETEDMVIYECKTCGGEVVAQRTTMATVCPYCGEAVSMTTKSVGEFRPELVIPFAREKKEIVQVFKEYVKKSFLTPVAFKKDNIVEKIQGVFVPFYLHTVEDSARHVLTGEKISHSRRGDDRVTTHKVYSLHINADGKFDKLPTDAAKGIENELMDALEPFVYKDLKSYNPAYMAGYVAEQKDEELSELQDRAKDRCESGMDDKAREAFANYSAVMIVSKHHDFGEMNSQYVMLPVWILNVKHNGEKYKFAINGQTGKIVGKLPVDWGKFAAVCAGVFAAAEVLSALILPLVL